MTASTLTHKQTKTFGPKPISGYGSGGTITAKVRYDDECGNGHNTFAITAEIVTDASRRQGDIAAGGMLHGDIAESFPELAPFLKWHLMSSAEPMHYVANTIYHASDRDFRGLLKGEKVQLRNGRTKLPVWHRVMRDADGVEVNNKGTDWKGSEEKPTGALSADWEPVWIVGEGKERDLNAARSTAVWPDATDDELTSPGLKERLEARREQLLTDFRRDVESLGFTW